MPGPFDIPLGVNPPIREVAQRFAGGEFGARGEFIGMVHDAHAFTTATGSRFDQQRKTHCAGVGYEGLHAAFPRAAWRHRNAVRDGEFPRPQLVAHEFDHVRLRADEAQTRAFHCGGEAGILRQKSVSRMHRIRVGLVRGGEQLGDIKIGRSRHLGMQFDRSVGGRHMRRLAIGEVVDGRGLQTEGAGGTLNPARDLTAVRNQDMLNRHGA